MLWVSCYGGVLNLHILQRAEWWILAVDMSGPVARVALRRELKLDLPDQPLVLCLNSLQIHTKSNRLKYCKECKGLKNG